MGFSLRGTSAAEAATEDRLLFAALKRCATQNQVQHRVSQPPSPWGNAYSCAAVQRDFRICLFNNIHPPHSPTPPHSGHPASLACNLMNYARSSFEVRHDFRVGVS